jgi:Chaperone of endosialidase
MKSILKPTHTVKRMKTKLILATAIGLALNSLNAQSIPTLMNYQGKVTDNAGVGIGTGTAVNRQIIFRIFDAPTGGNRLWSEQQTVTLSDGEFSVLLGQGVDAIYSTLLESPRPALNTVFSGTGARYIEIVVDGGDNDLNAGDTPITPRQRITSTAYAFRAISADSVANGSDMQFNGSSDYGLGFYDATRPFGGFSIDGPVLYGLGGVALGSVNGATQTSALRWNAAGKVAIGTNFTSPAASLTVGGGILARGGAPGAGAVNNNGYAFNGNGGDNDSGLYSTADGRVSLYTNGVERFVVTDAATTINNSFTLAGGLNTSTVIATGNVTAGTFVTAGNYVYAPLGFIKDNATGDGLRFFGNEAHIVAGSNSMIQAKPGFVGINGGVWNGATLRVYGAGTVNIGYGYLNANGQVGVGSGTNFYSIWSDNRVAASEFNAVSDARIKKVIGVSDSRKDLEQLMKLKITDYSFVDTVENGDRTQKKVIAQEVEQIYPSAISKTTNVIPDIMKKGTIRDGWIMVETNLKKGERIRIIGEGRSYEVFDVLEVKADKIRTSFKPVGKGKDGKEKELKEAFVYGREVNDFRTVDYDALGMLNISATQQVKRDSDTAEEALRKENETLRNKIAEMEKKIASSEKSSSATEARLAALEKALGKDAKPAARTASLKAGE